MSNIESGARLAGTIGSIKWVLIALAITVDIVSVIAQLLDKGGEALTMVLVIVASTAVWVLFVWVLFGWFEHTLSALVTIARNTGDPERYRATHESAS